MTRPYEASSTRRAIRNAVLSQASSAVFQSMLLQGGVLALLLLWLGGSEFEVGLIFMLHNAAFMARLLTASRLDVGRLKRIVYRWQIVSCAMAAAVLVAYPLAVVWNPTAGRWAVVTVLGLYFIARQMGQAAWAPLMSQIIPLRVRGRAIGRMRTILRAVALGAILFAGWMLGHDPGLGQFLPVLGVGIGAYCLRLYFVRRLPDPEAPRAGPREPLWHVLKRPIGDVPFRRFVCVAFVVRAFPMFTLPFLVPFLVTELGVPSSYAVYAASFTMLGGMATLSMWGRMADRWGSRSTYTLSLVALSGSALVYAMAPPYAISPALTLGLAGLGFALHGAGGAGVGIAETVRMMRQSPGEFRGSYMTLVATAHGLAGAAASLAGGLLLASLPTVMAVGEQSMYVKRVYFASMALLAVTAIAMLGALTPIGEPAPRRRVEPLVELASIFQVPPLGYLRARWRRRRSADVG